MTKRMLLAGGMIAGLVVGAASAAPTAASASADGLARLKQLAH